MGAVSNRVAVQTPPVPAAASNGVDPLPTMKRKREAVEQQVAPHEIVVAALTGDERRLLAALEGRAKHGKKASQQQSNEGCDAQPAEQSFGGCTPLIAAVLGGSAACIKIIASQVGSACVIIMHGHLCTGCVLPCASPWLSSCFHCAGCTPVPHLHRCADARRSSGPL